MYVIYTTANRIIENMENNNNNKKTIIIGLLLHVPPEPSDWTDKTRPFWQAPFRTVVVASLWHGRGLYTTERKSCVYKKDRIAAHRTQMAYNKESIYIYWVYI